MKLGKSKTGPIYVICWYNNSLLYTVSDKYNQATLVILFYKFSTKNVHMTFTK